MTQQTLAELGRRAATDPTFRALALKNPAAAMQQVAGEALPDGFKLRIVENDGAYLTCVLPDPVESGDLSDAELESVAGGTGRPGPPKPPTPMKTTIGSGSFSSQAS